MASGPTKQLGEAMFKHVAQRRAPSLFKKMMRSLDSGEYHVPKSFQVLSRFPSDELKLHHAQPLRVRLPENHIMQQLQSKLPEAKQEPVALLSIKPPLARQLAWLHLLPATKRWRRQDATAAAQAPQQDGGAQAAEVASCTTLGREDQEVLEARIHALARSAEVPSGHLGLLQAEEEIQLRAALDALSGKGLPAAGGGGGGAEGAR